MMAAFLPDWLSFCKHEKKEKKGSKNRSDNKLSAQTPHGAELWRAFPKQTNLQVCSWSTASRTAEKPVKPHGIKLKVDWVNKINVNKTWEKSPARCGCGCAPLRQRSMRLLRRGCSCTRQDAPPRKASKPTRTIRTELIRGGRLVRGDVTSGTFQQ